MKKHSQRREGDLRHSNRLLRSYDTKCILDWWPERNTVVCMYYILIGLSSSLPAEGPGWYSLVINWFHNSPTFLDLLFGKQWFRRQLASVLLRLSPGISDLFVKLFGLQLQRSTKLVKRNHCLVKVGQFYPMPIRLPLLPYFPINVRCSPKIIFQLQNSLPKNDRCNIKGWALRRLWPQQQHRDDFQICNNANILRLLWLSKADFFSFGILE